MGSNDGIVATGTGNMLPLRVRQAIQRQQEAGQVLVGVVQVGIVTVFGILYAVAPKTFSEDAGIEPVPWALAGYFLFALVSFGLAYARRQPHWFRVLSPLVDIGVVLLLIWTFHIQYQQPAAFVLKSPTLLYIFIFIALRSLLFNPAYVVITGVSAAIGWFAIVTYSIVFDGKGTITRNYVEYMTSNTVLLGAEFDKVISIILVTVIIAVAMARARSLLITATAEGTRARDLERFFEPDVARQITEAETEITPGRGQARSAAILFVDIRGFTDMVSATPPDEIIALLTEYQARLLPPIHAHGGTSEKFLGDGMVAAFGAVVENDHCVADALNAVEHILKSVDDWNAVRGSEGRAAIKVGLAVTAGRVVFGAVGDDSRLEYAVVGHPVNLAAKLEKLNKDEGTRALCTDDAYQTALSQGYRTAAAADKLPQRIVQGVSDPIDLVILAR